MERQKKNLDIRLILKQLNIPIEKYEEWSRLEIDDAPLAQKYPESWKTGGTSLRRQKA